MKNEKTVSTESMQASICARKDVFQVLKKLPLYLEGGERSRRKERLERFLRDLHTAAWANVEEYRESDAGQAFPVYCAEGQEANWLWLDDKLQYCREMDYPASADFLLATCKVIEEEYAYADSYGAENAQTILQYLEQKYGYLSNVITSEGLHLLLFPSVRSASDLFEFTTQPMGNGGIEICGIIFPGGGEHEKEIEALVYESVAATILDSFIQGDELEEDVLVLLEQHWDPLIGTCRSEDQIGAYYDAVRMGISYQAPFGDFEFYAEYSEDDKRFWSAYASHLMAKIAEENA